MCRSWCATASSSCCWGRPAPARPRRCASSPRLLKQDEGSVLFDGEPVDDLTPADRDVAFVFQQYSLYPTMTVYDNLAFPLRSPLRKTPEAEIKQRVQHVAEILRISHLLERKTAQPVGRRDAARVDRPGHRARAAHLPDGRAAVQPGRQAARVAAGRAAAHAEDPGQHDALRHPRPDRGADHGRPHRRARTKAASSRSARRSTSTTGRPPPLWRQLVGTPRINLLPARREDGTSTWTTA